MIREVLSINPDDLQEGMFVTFTCTMEFRGTSMGGGLWFALPKGDHYGADIQDIYFHKAELVNIVSVKPTKLEPKDRVVFEGVEGWVISCTDTHAWLSLGEPEGVIAPISELTRVTNIPILKQGENT